MDPSSALFNDLLRALEVPHTEGYSRMRFMTMPFRSLFGLTKLLAEYGIESRGVRFPDRDRLRDIPVPFLAGRGCGFVVVSAIAGGMVEYVGEGVAGREPYDRFRDSWSGVALLAYPGDGACEPDFRLHRREEFFMSAKRYLLIAALVFLCISLFVAGRLYENLWTIPVMLLDVAGLCVSWLLLLKQLKVRSSAADRVCGVIQAGGCDTVLETRASSFFGLFGWSEVGFSYFGTSLLALLLFPRLLPWLAVLNVCCLPFSFWSVWYQHFRARAWCTLCLTVQAVLWLLFFSYLAGGWFEGSYPPVISLPVLGAAYLSALLGLNRLMSWLKGMRQSQ